MGIATTKLCTQCHKEKPLDEFFPLKTMTLGKASHCKLCQVAVRKKSRLKRNKERPGHERRINMAAHLRNNFGLTIEDYEQIHERQGGVCAICRNPEIVCNRHGVPKLLAVDHNHAMGKVRGLLCHHCNVGLGNFKDSVVSLKRAIVYMESWD